MKTIIIYLSIILTTSLLYGQSSIVFDAGTFIDVGTGADICAATITINGTFSGGGTFCNLPVEVEIEDDSEIPEEFSLSQNYPNPFNPSTTISFAIPKQEFVSLKVFDVLGRRVEVLMNEIKAAGYYEINFNSGKLPSGTYIYEIRAGNFVQTKKMVLLK
ncbi:MAG: T9SS type A sorting domain-containing protein [Ignavibacteria bacterium]|nr:T9SS type A sorting domain-containing protein [Ignavibacteria bacterium]